MMDKDDLRRDSLREGLKTKGRSRREAAARHAEAERGDRRPHRNDILPSLQIEPCPVDALKPHVRKLRKSDPAHVREVANSISTLGFNVPLLVGKDNVVVDGDARLEAATGCREKTSAGSVTKTCQWAEWARPWKRQNLQYSWLQMTRLTKLAR